MELRKYRVKKFKIHSKVQCSQDYFPVFQPDDPVATLQRAQPVGDGDDGQGSLQPVDGVHDRQFGLVIQRAGGLVQDQDLWPVVKGAGQPDALPLSA